MTKLKLKLVNKGKPFTLPNWTVAKHKAVLEEINKLPKGTSESDKDIEFQYFCVYVGLKVIDQKLEIEEVKVWIKEHGGQLKKRSVDEPINQPS